MLKPILFGKKYFRSIFDAFPCPVFILDHSHAVHDANLASKRMFGNQIYKELKRLCGDYIGCMHAIESSGGCGTSIYCPECVIRQVMESISIGETPFRQIADMKLKRESQIVDMSFLVSGSPMRFSGNDYVVLILEDITELTALRKIVSICSYCNKLKDKDGKWHRIEPYMGKYFNISFSHGICPDCGKEHFPDTF